MIRFQRRRRGEGRGVWATVLFGSLVAHLIGLAVFGVFKFAHFLREPEAKFVVDPKQISIPAENREHKMDMARHMAMAPKPTFNDRLVSVRPTEFALPELPKLPLDQMLPTDPSELISDQLATISGAAGLGSGAGQSLFGGGGKGSGFSFFDIKDEARSVVIMIDVSASMFGRTGDLDYGTGQLLRQGKQQSFQTIRDEATRLIDGLSANTLFNVMHWSGSARLWRDQLCPATAKNKAEAKEHIQTRVDHNQARPTGGRPGGTRHDYALEALFPLNAEVAFMLTDGNATQSKGGGGFEVIPEDEIFQIIETQRREAGKVPRIHAIYYLTGSDKDEEEKLLRGIARRTGGHFRKHKAARK